MNVRDFDVIYVYPRARPAGRAARCRAGTRRPGARGCTPQSCAFRDLLLRSSASRVAGLSAQTLDDQLEFAERNRMPFPVVADPDREARRRARACRRSRSRASTLYKRITLVAEDARIVKVFYPVFPPDENAGDVLAWLRAR